MGRLGAAVGRLVLAQVLLQALVLAQVLVQAQVLLQALVLVLLPLGLVAFRAQLVVVRASRLAVVLRWLAAHSRHWRAKQR